MILQKRHEYSSQQEEEINVINTMKQDIKELKEMIQTLIGKQNG